MGQQWQDGTCGRCIKKSRSPERHLLGTGPTEDSMRSLKRIEDMLDNNNVWEASERGVEKYTRAEPA